MNLGDAVQPAQLLVQLDNDQIRAQWQAAQAALAAVQAQAARASADAHRIRNLFAKESVTRQELDAALAAERATRAQAEEARHRAEAIRAQLEETELRAPFAGSIIARRVDPGDLALPGQTLVHDNRHRLPHCLPHPLPLSHWERGAGGGVRVKLPHRGQRTG